MLDQSPMPSFGVLLVCDQCCWAWGSPTLPLGNREVEFAASQILVAGVNEGYVGQKSNRMPAPTNCWSAWWFPLPTSRAT